MIIGFALVYVITRLTLFVLAITKSHYMLSFYCFSSFVPNWIVTSLLCTGNNLRRSLWFFVYHNLFIRWAYFGRIFFRVGYEMHSFQVVADIFFKSSLFLSFEFFGAVSCVHYYHPGNFFCPWMCSVQHNVSLKDELVAWSYWIAIDDERWLDVILMQTFSAIEDMDQEWAYKLKMLNDAGPHFQVFP